VTPFRTGFADELEKLGGVRTNELLSALKVVATTKPSKEHMRGWSRHSALNAGQATSDAAQALKLKKGPWVKSTKEEAKDALNSAIYAILPPTHHTAKDMKGFMDYGHRDWFRYGMGKDLPLKKISAPVDPTSKANGKMEKLLKGGLARYIGEKDVRNPTFPNMESVANTPFKVQAPKVDARVPKPPKAPK